MTTKEIATKLVALCREGQNVKAIQELYSPNIVSLEAFDMPNMKRETRGIEGVLGKSKWWMDNHTVHSAKASDPFVSNEKFAVNFEYEITFKPTGKRTKMSEVAVYTVEGGKVVHEEFLYGNE